MNRAEPPPGTNGPPPGKTGPPPGAAEPPPRMKVKRRGNSLGIWFFRIAVRCTGLRGAYGLLYIVCFWYALFDRTAVRGAEAYLSKRFPGQGRLKRFLSVYRLFINQGKNLIDRFILVSGAAVFDITFRDEQRFVDFMKGTKKGFTLLMSHMGNWQVILSALSNVDRTVCLLMRPEDNPAVSSSFKISDENDKIRVISPEGDLGGVVEIMNALDKGHIISIMGDRSYGFSHLEVDFLGSRARFPFGAFSIAAASGCPIVVLMTSKVSAREYEIEVGGIFEPVYERGVPKKEQLRGWVQLYARVLESYVERFPFQCFLFHDIWSQPETVTGKRDREVDAERRAGAATGTPAEKER